MKRLQFKFPLTVIIFCLICFYSTNAQDNWASWSKVIPIKDYQGHRFKLSARVKVLGEDNQAAARLWARIDKDQGVGFFDNMMDRPVRKKQWNTNFIEGTIDSAAKQLVIGALTELNGKFYYDDVKVEVEKEEGKWATVYNNNFENGLAGWAPGATKNIFFKALTNTEASTKNKAFLIEGHNVPNYGFDKKRGKFAEVNGIRLYYEVYGKGAPLVVLHGNGGSISNAGGHYAELIKKYKVIAIDSRSQGQSTDTDIPLTYEQMASDVAALLDQINVDSALIWGQSDGAILGLILAMDYPIKVKRVIAFAPNIQPDSAALFPWAITAMNRITGTSKNEKELKLTRLMLDHPNIAYTKLNTIKAPCLIIGGDRDGIRPEHLVKIFQNIPNAHLCILPGSTHGGAWEKQEMFLTILNDFFTRTFTMPTTEDWFRE